jgi:hypothetical protein
MLGDVGVEVDQDEVEVVGQPAHREKDDNQGKHLDYLRNYQFSLQFLSRIICAIISTYTVPVGFSE